ncbi:hypothetical protein [Streptomyces sp. NPDC001975]
MDSNHSTSRLIREHWGKWGRTVTVNFVRGASTAAGGAIISFIVWWLRNR